MADWLDGDGGCFLITVRDHPPGSASSLPLCLGGLTAAAMAVSDIAPHTKKSVPITAPATYLDFVILATGKISM